VQERTDSGKAGHYKEHETQTRRSRRKAATPGNRLTITAVDGSGEKEARSAKHSKEVKC
jgi:hypothetical protein